MCKHLEVIIEVSLIPLYSALYLPPFRGFRARFRMFSWETVSFVGHRYQRNFLNDTNILYITNVIYTNT